MVYTLGVERDISGAITLDEGSPTVPVGTGTMSTMPVLCLLCRFITTHRHSRHSRHSTGTEIVGEVCNQKPVAQI